MTSIPPTAGVEEIKGIVHGGQQPVAGAKIQLYAPGTTGYGSAGSVVVSTTTDGNGNFTLPQPYTCPSNSLPMILVAVGGNAGAGTNSAISEVAMVGPCSGLTPSTYIYVSEVTTVAAAYALAPFASVAPNNTNVGTSATNFQGLINAGATAANLANSTTGQAPGANSIGGVVLPTAEVNTLADILASCVNSGVAGIASTTCSALFTAATPPGGSAPTDTFAAAVDIALNPGNNAAALYALATPSAPYQPTLTTVPGDFALGIVYYGAIIGQASGTTGIDIDANGNAWVAVFSSSTTGGPNGLLEISPGGAISPSNGSYLGPLNGPQGVAVNSLGYVEVVDTGNVQEFHPMGAPNSGFNYVAPTSLIGPVGIAIDNRDSSAWITNFDNNSVTHISQLGVELTNSSPLPAGSYPLGVAIDGTGTIAIADSDYFTTGGPNSALVTYVPTGSGTYTGFIEGTGTGSFPYDVAIDNANNRWVTLNIGPGEFNSSGTELSPPDGYPSNGDNVPLSIAIDGLGRAFVSNSSYAFSTQPGTLTVYSNSGSLLSTSNSSYGYFANGILPVNSYFPKGLALDGSGNCWITGSVPTEVVELVGIAAPVVTPLAAQNAPTNQLGVRP